MISVVILGSGNVASHLTKVFLKTNTVDLVQVYSRKIENIEHLERKTLITDDITNLKNADVYIIAISDDAIEGFSENLDIDDALVVHTSGSVSIDALKGNYEKGVFYPLQTFSKGTKINFKNIPICVESNSSKQLNALKKLANSISKKVYVIDSNQREKLHLGAVFVNNFVNHLYEIGNEICEENNVPFEILQPLIKETAKKITKISPSAAQTGPAKRKDTETIKKHLDQLKKNQKEIYKIMTDSIIKKYN